MADPTADLSLSDVTSGEPGRPGDPGDPGVPGGTAVSRTVSGAPDDRGTGGLTHVREDGSAHMVDVTGKNETSRTAVATGRVRTRPDVLDMVFADDSEGLPKGDALPVARVAGIMGAKKTPEIIPLCHPLPLGKITVDFRREDAATHGADAVRIRASVKTRGVTGVEMEALTAVTTAALTVYDMIKAVDRHGVIDDVRVLAKSGGKSGSWDVRDAPADGWGDGSAYGPTDGPTGGPVSGPHGEGA